MKRKLFVKNPVGSKVTLEQIQKAIAFGSEHEIKPLRIAGHSYFVVYDAELPKNRIGTKNTLLK